MRRREFIRLLSGAAAWPLAVRAQGERMRRIGVIVMLLVLAGCDGWLADNYYRADGQVLEVALFKKAWAQCAGQAATQVVPKRGDGGERQVIADRCMARKGYLRR